MTAYLRNSIHTFKSSQIAIWLSSKKGPSNLNVSYVSHQPFDPQATDRGNLVCSRLINSNTYLD